MNTKINFFNFTVSGLEAEMKKIGVEKFRARQLFRWVYGRRVTDIDQMTDIGRDTKEILKNNLEFKTMPIVSHQISVDGTQKFLFDVGNNETIESVLIPSGERLTLCVSSEVGCNMGCRFCFTGKQKMRRRLLTSEIGGQLWGAIGLLPENTRVTNIVFMGMGEPLDNTDAVFESVEIFHEPLGWNMSRKKITVSTSGIVPMMPLVTKSGARLAVSLNAVNDRVRDFVMPINKKWPLVELLEACREYCSETGDRVTFEYVLLKGVTDSMQDAKDLVKLVRGIPCKINIIPFNEHPGSGFERPDEETIEAFQNELMRLGIHVLRRKTMGRDIYAACGQLRSMYENHPKVMET
jgi:23S rRNA (adenine2503-C2)-methyltransferase